MSTLYQVYITVFVSVRVLLQNTDWLVAIWDFEQELFKPLEATGMNSQLYESRISILTGKLSLTWRLNSYGK